MMNDTPENTTPPADPNPEPFQSCERTEETKSDRKTVGEAMKDALKKGRDDAANAARKAAPKIKSGVGKAAYGAAYGVSYGLGFGIALLKEAVPQSMKDGACAGSEAGKIAVEKMLTREEAADATVTDAAPTPA